MRKIHVLGEGITANAVRSAISRHRALSETSMDNADWVVVSPGMPFQQWPETDKEIISEIELAYRLFHSEYSTYKPKILGITGTNGKSTITSLIAQHSGYPACGNIGIPLIEWFCADNQPEWLIVELSSYQLHACKHFCPDIAVLSSFAPDHLAWHQSKAHYQAAKEKLFQNMTDQAILMPASLLEIFPSLEKYPALQLVEPEDSNLALHLANNLALSNACLKHLGFETIQLQSSFQAILPHRLEKVESALERVFINDSKATNPEACLAALAACEDKSVYLILCGEDKALDLEDFYRAVFKKAEKVIVFGDLKKTLHAYLKQPKLLQTDTLKEALQLAYQYSKADDLILFSPSSSSYDQFQGFEDRGNAFRQAVATLEKSLER